MQALAIAHLCGDSCCKGCPHGFGDDAWGWPDTRTVRRTKCRQPLTAISETYAVIL